MNKKPWYEKLSIWFGIVVGIFSVLGISVFNNKSIVKDDDQQDTVKENFLNDEDKESPQLSSHKDENLDLQNKINEQEETMIAESTKGSEIEPTITPKPQEPVSNPVVQDPVSPFVTSSPASDGVINVNLSNWNDDDRDIFNNKYSGSTAMKLSVFNTINAIGGGADDITAEIHLPLGERFNESWIINFVVMQDMVGNGSYANVTILSGEKELYPSFIIESDTTDKIEYEVDLNGVRDLIIRFECHAVSGGFCGGVIFTDEE